jgi:hypothetical protein
MVGEDERRLCVMGGGGRTWLVGEKEEGDGVGET